MEDFWDGMEWNEMEWNEEWNGMRNGMEGYKRL
jgi:hypothetical protein